MTFGFAAATQAMRGNFGVAKQLLSDLGDEMHRIGDETQKAGERLFSFGKKKITVPKGPTSVATPATQTAGPVQRMATVDVLGIQEKLAAIGAKTSEKKKKADDTLTFAQVTHLRALQELGVEDESRRKEADEALAFAQVQHQRSLQDLEAEDTRRKKEAADELAFAEVTHQRSLQDLEAAAARKKKAAADQESLGRGIIENARSEWEFKQKQLAIHRAEQESLGQAIMENAKSRWAFEEKERKRAAIEQEQLGQVILENAKAKIRFEESQKQKINQGRLDEETILGGRISASRIRGGNPAETARLEVELLNKELERLRDQDVMTAEQQARVMVITAEMQNLQEEIKVLGTDVSDNLRSSFAGFFSDIGRGKGVFKSLGDAFESFAGRMNNKLAEMASDQAFQMLFGDKGKTSSDSGSGGFLASVGGFLGGIGSIFSAANGGVMTSRGPMQLRRFASGGIASSPSLALFGEGSTNEAFVPLPDGRSIPVSMKGKGGGMSVSVTMDISTPDVKSFLQNTGQVAARLQSAVTRAAQRNL